MEFMPQIELFLQCFPTDPILKNICPSTKKEKKGGEIWRRVLRLKKPHPLTPRILRGPKWKKKQYLLISRSIQNYLVHFIVLFKTIFNRKGFFFPPFASKPLSSRCYLLKTNANTCWVMTRVHRPREYFKGIPSTLKTFFMKNISFFDFKFKKETRGT